jgi:hypothetical protein
MRGEEGNRARLQLLEVEDDARPNKWGPLSVREERRAGAGSGFSGWAMGHI